MNNIIFRQSIKHLVKNKQGSLFNMIGLIMSLTCCLIIYNKIRYELSFDRFHSDYEKTYRIVRHTRGLGLNLPPGEWEYRVGVYGALPDAVEKEVPQIKKITSILRLRDFTLEIPSSNNVAPSKYKFKENAAYVKPNYFEIFDFKHTDFSWIKGSPRESLEAPYSVVLTKGYAQKYYPNTDVIGKTLKIQDDIYTITGLVSEIPSNTDLPFHMFLSFSTIQARWKNFTNDWGSLTGSHQCYVVLNDNKEKNEIEAGIKHVHSKHCNEEKAENRLFKLQALKEIHQDSKFGNFNNKTISSTSIFILGIIGVLILIMACVNYSNLALVKSRCKSKDVGIRKTIGSKRSQIIMQFFYESLSATILSVIIAQFLCLLLITNFPDIIGIPDSRFIFIDIITVGTLLALVILVSLTSHGYPALIISSYKPIDLIGNKFDQHPGKTINFSQSILIFQFVISILMITGSLIIYRQYQYITNTDYGFNTESVITVHLPENDKNNRERFRNELVKNPSIESISFSNSSPARSASWSDITAIMGNIESRVVSQFVHIDSSYLGTYDLQLIHGTNFQTYNSENQILINEKLYKELGFINPEEAIDKEVRLYYPQGPKATISGIVKDYHYSPMHEKIRPTALVLNPDRVNIAGIKLKPLPEQTSTLNLKFRKNIEYIEKTWRSIYQNKDIYEYEFLDETIRDYYKNEANMANLIGIFTIATIMITCLGVLGLAYYINESKTKEIGIRKVNGAKVQEILAMLNTAFIKWIIIAFIVASPIAWYVMKGWLENFAYKTEISWWIFALSGAIAMVIALVTVSFQSYRAASKNPVESLRYE